jgi:hypothetical protein
MLAQNWSRSRAPGNIPPIPTIAIDRELFITKKIAV